MLSCTCQWLRARAWQRLPNPCEVPAAAVWRSEKATLKPSQADFCKATCLVIGNEGRGISPDVLDQCDVLVAIPQTGKWDR